MLFSIIRGGSFSFSDIIIYILSSLAVVFLTLPIHEYAHGLAATKLGDPTPRYQGRMTLNPLAHIDYIGAACIVLFGFGWAKPVQVNSRYFKNPKRDMAITAAAGPIANLVVCFVCLFIISFCDFIIPAGTALPIFLSYVIAFFNYIAYINVYLAIFNLIPIPPLDGSRLLSALLPYKQYYALMRYERYFFFAILLLLWTGVLSTPISWATGKVFGGIYYLASFIFRLF